MSREFGIYPETCNPRQWWGARAIIADGRMDILTDRQNYEKADGVLDTDKKSFFDWLTNEVDTALQKEAKAGYFKEWENTLIRELLGHE